MSAASLYLNTCISVVRGISILLSASVGFLTGLEKSAMMVVSCGDPCLTVVVLILLLTLCHTCTHVFDAPAATTITMF